ncbi:hypothetical protein [Tenacibaculum dicentrarchi]|uniref:hypothetical protein n=1 Tax=Tenacibaculum dicentrarchi TaxID=669041 RepID=UPI003517FD86
MRLKISLILVLLTNITLFAQVKIGDNPSDINPTSILELESTDKVFVLTRMDNTVMQSLLLSSDPNKRPLQGALVYNTTDNCVFMYNGTAWVSLCNLATSSIKVTPLADNPPTTNNNLGDFWINTTTNQTSLFDGTAWVLLNPTTNTTSTVEITKQATAPTLNNTKGDFWINTTTNQTSLFDGTNWVLLNPTTNTTTTVEITKQATAPTLNNTKGDFWINTTTNQTSLFDGTAWVLLNPTTNTTSTVEITKQATAPTLNNTKGDFWMNTTTNQTSIYNGTAWVLLNENPKKGTGVPTNTTAPNSVAGDIYVDTVTGTIYAHNGTAWVTQTSTTVTANNGLNINTTTNAVELGGALTKPTTITTDATNTLTIEGLQDGNATTDKVVTVDANGVLRKVTLANIAVRQEETLLTAATLNQVEFLVTLKTEDKINVYRNGVRVGFTVNTAKTGITLEPGAKCYTGDQIRIVQIY